MTTSAQFWDKIADGYAKRPVRDQVAYEKTLEKTAGYLRSEHHVLELGCGTGSTALSLSGVPKQITASDYSPKMIRIARDKARVLGVENVNFVCADVSDPRLSEQSYDVVTAFNLLHLLKDPEAVIRDVAGKLKPGGLFISKTPGLPGRGAPFIFRVMLLALPLLQFLGKAPFVQFMSEQDLRAALERSGFRVLETGAYPTQPPNHFIVAQKID